MSIKLQIKAQDRQTFWVTTDPTDTVMQLKQVISTEIDSSTAGAGAIVLFFNGQKLGNNKTLVDYSITDGDTLIMLSKQSSNSGD